MKLLLVLAPLMAGCNVPPDANKYPPPTVSCAPDDAGAVCAPPPSSCADQHWIVYYDDGQCVKNQCTWTTQFFNCRGDDPCYGGGCNYSGETAPYTYGP